MTELQGLIIWLFIGLLFAVAISAREGLKVNELVVFVAILLIWPIVPIAVLSSYIGENFGEYQIIKPPKCPKKKRNKK